MNAAHDEVAAVEVLRNEPLRKHTSWRVGGPADSFYAPTTQHELKRILKALPAATPVHWLGLGSNLLVRDGGIRGAVISTSALPKTFEALGSGRVRCSAGLPCATLAKRAAREGLGPAAFFAGIPGSLGGALAMNAGAFGGETWDCIESVGTIDRSGALHTRTCDEYEIDYRSVRGPEAEWFLDAVFAFRETGAGEQDEIRSLLRQRAEKQPLGLPSAGSVFRNPAGGHAGELIERSGLKGLRCGGAVVAEKHANFIINAGEATAADIETLIETVRARVQAATGVLLEPEVRIVGERGELQ